MHGQLAGRVRVGAGEEHHPPAADAAGDVLDRRGLRAAPLELLADRALVSRGLDLVLGEDPRQVGVAGQPRGERHLGERLLLDRMDVGQVLRQLLVERAIGHGVGIPADRPSDDRAAPAWQALAPMPAPRRLVALALVASPLPACAAGQAAAAVAPAGTTPVLTTGAGISAARTWARTRAGTVGFAVLDVHGRLRGLNRTVAFPSASVSKAMLMVAVLRRARDRALTAGEHALLHPMITVSDNDAAREVYRSVGDPGLLSVARAAGMRRFGAVGHWSGARLTPADQTRLFLRLDRVVPARHRQYARTLLGSIVTGQRWGIARVAARHHMAALFKGGWRKGIVHQVALLERDGRRIAIAVLTDGQPSQAYGRATLEGIAARVLG